MGVHRMRFDWWAVLRRHSVWVVTAAAVFTVTAAVSYAARETTTGERESAQETEYPLYPTALATETIPGSVSVDQTTVEEKSTSSSRSAQESGPVTPTRSRATQTGDESSRPTEVSDPDAGAEVSSGGGGLVAVYTLREEWPEGYVATVTIANGGTTGSEWTLGIELPPGSTFVSWWNGTFDISGNTATVTGSGYASTLGAGSSVTVGYRANRERGAESEPVSCLINGLACDI